MSGTVPGLNEYIQEFTSRESLGVDEGLFGKRRAWYLSLNVSANKYADSARKLELMKM